MYAFVTFICKGLRTYYYMPYKKKRKYRTVEIFFKFAFTLNKKNTNDKVL